MNEAIIHFDTHGFVKHLTQRGFTEEQAEALAEEQAKLLKGNLASKSDLEIGLANLKVELLKWIFGGLVAQVGVIVTLVKLLG